MLESYRMGEMWENEEFQHKLRQLPSHTQESFLTYLDEMYHQESDMMLNFISESRRELNLTGAEIKAEQDALKITSNKLSSTRLSSATPRPRSSRGSDAGSSMDSVTFEVENKLAVERYMRRREKKSKEQKKEAKKAPGKAEYGAQPYPEPADDLDSDAEYKQEQEAIISSMRTMSARHEEQRARQAKIIQEKREAKMKKQKEREDVATGLVREASALDELKRKDKERQEQILKEKLEEKKKKKKDKKKNAVDPGEGGETPEEEGGEKKKKKKKDKDKDRENEGDGDSVTVENELDDAEKKKKKKKKDNEKDEEAGENGEKKKKKKKKKDKDNDAEAEDQ